MHIPPKKWLSPLPILLALLAIISSNGACIVRMMNTFSPRGISLGVFSLFFSWLLAFPFEGQVLYALSSRLEIDPRPMVVSAVAAHFAGLCLSGLVIRTMQAARKLMISSIIIAWLATALFFLPPSILWTPALVISSFLAGCCVAAWGFFFQAFTPSNERIKTAADGLIYSNILMIVLNISAIHLSPYSGLGLCMLFLTGALLFAYRLPQSAISASPALPAKSECTVSIVKPLAFLYLFIAILTFNSGLMYQVLNPAFKHLEWLVSWYWAIPYIAAIYIMRNLSRRTNRSYILYASITMIGFAFLGFMVFDRSALSYLLVNTLMLGACGIYDLFWWSILGEMLDLYYNPAMLFGIGLSANVLGVLAGGIVGSTLAIPEGGSQQSMILALAVLCLVFAILPPLSKYLTELLKTHVYLTTFAEMSPEIQRETVQTFVAIGPLTARESQIASLIIQGSTYKQVAGTLHVSENTVKTHVKNIYAKYNVQNRNQLLHLMMNKNSTHLQ